MNPFSSPAMTTVQRRRPTDATIQLQATTNISAFDIGQEQQHRLEVSCEDTWSVQSPDAPSLTCTQTHTDHVNSSTDPNININTEVQELPSDDQTKTATDLRNQFYSLLLDSPRIDILSKLPYEMTIYILKLLDMATLSRVALVSKTWNQFTTDNELWKNIFLHHQRWKIKSLPVTHTYLPDTSQNKDTAELSATTAARVSPGLDWKHLCHDRKILETRWQSVPAMTKLSGHDDSVYCIQFDSTKIVTGSRDRTIKFWDATTLKCTDTLRGHSQSVLCLQFNDKIMVSGSSDNSIIVWNMETRQPISTLYGHEAGVLDVCFDEKYIVSCSKDTSIKIWDVETKALLRSLRGHRGPVNAIQLHKGQVVSASGDGLVKLWDVATGSCVRDFVGHERGLACVQFNGETIVSGSNDRTIRIWEAATGRCIRVLSGHENLVRTLHFDQNRVVSGSYDQTVKVWDMTTGECTLDLNNGHVSWVFDVQFSPTRIISTSQDRNIVVWDFGVDLDADLFA